MEIPADIASAIHDEFLKAENILIMSHRSPDADAIGSNLALRFFAEKKGKKVTSACIDSVNGCNFVPAADSFVKDFRPDEFDLFVSVDSGSTAQAAFPEKYPEILKGKSKLINIDHHPSNNKFGDLNLVKDDAASTTLIIFSLLKTWNEKIDSDTATCLLYGIYYDTGSFMHSNTTDEVYEAASELMTLGARKDLIIKNLFKSHTIERLRLLGKILDETQMTAKNTVISAIRDEDIKNCEADLSDVSGAIDFLNMAKGNRFAALLTEDGNGNIRGSLRTKYDDLNLSEVAGSLGGGGHKKASGFTIRGKLKKEIRWTIKPAA